MGFTTVFITAVQLLLPLLDTPIAPLQKLKTFSVCLCLCLEKERKQNIPGGLLLYANKIVCYCVQIPVFGSTVRGMDKLDCR